MKFLFAALAAVAVFVGLTQALPRTTGDLATHTGDMGEEPHPHDTASRLEPRQGKWKRAENAKPQEDGTLADIRPYMTSKEDTKRIAEAVGKTCQGGKPAKWQFWKSDSDWVMACGKVLTVAAGETLKILESNSEAIVKLNENVQLIYETQKAALTPAKKGPVNKISSGNN
ncbi:MAG: hypothetical protein M1831_003827 [Alyxoria varia]|nr:MAG: hypothetical protein M1831_003827 [Alyxoria varia]